FKEADFVGVIEIKAGDSENYEKCIYKANIIKSYKGNVIGKFIYLGPYIGLSIGNQYLAFLKNTNKSLNNFILEKDSEKPLPFNGLEIYYNIMYGGYSILPINYICVFDGKEIKDQCDYGIKINTYQVKLPGKLNTFPVSIIENSNADTKWIRRDQLLKYIENL